MSLHDAAKHLAAQGRGPDNTLVHMSKDEVAGLQAIAKMKGGSLTINPKTGMAEAGFLDDIMPTLVGAAGMYFGVPPEVTAAVMGGGTALSSGDLGKGLMAGLGAYGGGNLTGGVMEAGTGALGADVAPFASNADKLSAGFGAVTGPGGFSALQAGMPIGGTSALGSLGMAAAPALMGMMQPKGVPGAAASNQMIRPYTFAMNPQTKGNMVGDKPMIGASYQPGQDTSERLYFQPQYTALTPYKAAGGGLMDLQSMAAGGGPVEQMSNATAVGENTMYPMASMNTSAFATPYQDPKSSNMLSPTIGGAVDQMTGELKPQGTRLAAGGGISSLGGYADGGNPRLLKGPGDGMSDNIPAMIGDKQPARLADGEFVVPADVVSHLGNGSTDAGAKQLYKMMDRIRQQRTGKKKQAPEVNPSKAMPA